tara:strand:+ start:2618 stop:2875 length:258 start_codon:yes stop_codon:yes gene_type:complete
MRSLKMEEIDQIWRFIMLIKQLEDQFHDWDLSDDKKFKTQVCLSLLVIAKSLDKLTKPYDKDNDKKEYIEEKVMKEKPKRARIGG